jgi:hypothetical protein
LPIGYNIEHLVAYSRSDKDGTRYVAVLQDGTIWWYAPKYPWQQSSVEGLPYGYKIKNFNAYMKAEGTRYVVVLQDSSLWWFAPGTPWQPVPMEGLPLNAENIPPTP